MESDIKAEQFDDFIIKYILMVFLVQIMLMRCWVGYLKKI